METTKVLVTTALGSREAMYSTLAALQAAAVNGQSVTNVTYAFADFYQQFVTFFDYHVVDYSDQALTSQRALVFALNSFDLYMRCKNVGLCYLAVQRLCEAEFEFQRNYKGYTSGLYE